MLVNNTLKRSIGSYAALATAALISTPQVANGEVITKTVDQNLTGGPFLVYIDNDLVADFSLVLGPDDLRISPTPGNHVLVEGPDLVKKIGNSAYLVDGDPNFNANPGLLLFSYSSSSSTSFGNWIPNVDEKFVGVKFMISGVAHLGWIRMTLSGSLPGTTVTIHDVGYESDPIPMGSHTFTPGPLLQENQAPVVDSDPTITKPVPVRVGASVSADKGQWSDPDNPAPPAKK